MKSISKESSVFNELLSKKKLVPDDVIVGRKTFVSNPEKIEIDITYECNLKCKSCNRSCGNAPSSEQMSLIDIENFIEDSTKNNKKYKMISILGGEPTLHTNFEDIILLLQKEYADNFNPDVIIQIVSNGFTEKSRVLCNDVENRNKNVRIDRLSYKINNINDYFTPFNDAPIDDINYEKADFSKACWVAESCGFGLNKNGYYACAICGGIDRVLQKNNGFKSIMDLTVEEQKKHFRQFCALCGNYKYYSSNNGNLLLRCEKAPLKNKVTKSWRNIYANYKEEV